jgi:transcriptional regulator with XRE-family HTH domain
MAGEIASAKLAPMTTTSVGDHLRSWRQRRRMSQLDLALEADISQKHLSFVESGRAVPSRDMVLRLADQLDVPLRERNTLLLAAGYAPYYPERALDDATMAPAWDTMQRVLVAHEPAPALVIDRHWNLVAKNRMVDAILRYVAPRLLEPPINVLRLSLDPDGMAPRIENLSEWRAHLLHRLRRQRAREDDAVLEKLHEQLLALPGPQRAAPSSNAIAVPLKLRADQSVLSFLSMTMVFGGPLDVTVAGLAIEVFLPEDGATADALRRIDAGLA